MSATEQSESASAPLDLGASSHEQMDEAVLSFLDLLFVGRSSDDLSLIDLARILSLVSVYSESLLDNKYGSARRAEELLKNRPHLQQAIREAFGARSFEKVRNMRMLWSSKAKALEPRQTEPSVNQVADLHKSFNRPYHGAAVDGFYEYLTKCNKMFSANNPSAYYAKFCSIVQSSGTGKSRLMTELRKKGVVVLYMNLRPIRDNGFPERDEIPSRILTEGLPKTAAEYTAQCCAFFTALFNTLRSDFNKSGSDSDVTQAVNKWNEDMCDMGSEARRRFFDRVDAKYQEGFSIITKKMAKPEDEVLVKDATDKMGGLKLADDSNKADKAPILEGGPGMVEEYQSMLRSLRGLFANNDHHPKLIIAFDEAHPLIVKQDHYRPSHILCRIINGYSRQSQMDAAVWAVFASTTSKVADFSAPQVIYDSLRVAEGGQLLFPPFTHLGWDQNADGLRAISANAVATFDHIIGFGRPLWSSLKEVERGGAGGIVATATVKLCKDNQFKPGDMDQALAVLSQRFGLDVCFGHPDSVSYLEKAVASHLRICIGTTEDRMWKFTSYPSEPFLSCVAANLLHTTAWALPSVLGILTEKVDSGMFKVGQGGELASRLLWLLAKDKYVREKLHPGTTSPYVQQPHANRGIWDVDFIDCQKVPIIPFLEYLFGEKFSAAMLPSNPLEQAANAFENAHINFSHWVTMEEDISPPKKGQKAKSKKRAKIGRKAKQVVDTKAEVGQQRYCANWALRHWLRTSAVQCCHGQPAIDKMIPIFFDPAKTNLDGHGKNKMSNKTKQNSDGDDGSYMSHLFISDKAGENDSRSDLNYIQRHKILTESDPKSKLPYICVLVDLGVERDDFKATYNKTSDCLRIYATRGTLLSAPFLKECPEMANALKHLVMRQHSPVYEEPFAKRLQAQVEFGTTALDRNMDWEAGQVVPQP
ncbi:hypothetical protein BJ138DRAFT_1130306 [Hygrophoropsis aurantiaca]|uniref:Uncharacterized protein n=1 Tax=Hygrophoropsis aurantiaca TaxID=72124 RepID=A0ACB7ZX18_9AGAM|nr:hypothetical protein BJ138DRAFT_1130306 [Hygrophoropsis aurantiaca]